MRPQLDTIATLLDQGAADSAVRMLRSSWEPELPAQERIPLYCMWIRGLCEMGDLEHALTLARRAAHEFARNPDILTAFGNVLDICGKLDEARDAFELAISMDGSSALAQYNYGAVVERFGDEAGAETAYRKAISLDTHVPSMVEANAALGALLRRQGRLEEAEAVYDAYLDEDPLEVEMLVEHGICLSDLSRLDEATARFQLAISLDADHASAWYNLAITLFRQGLQAEACAAMGRAHEADPRNPLARAVLGAWTLANIHTSHHLPGEALEVPTDTAQDVRADPNAAQIAAEETLPEGEADLDAALGLLYGAVELVRRLHDAGELGNTYASFVVEEVFEALWQCDRRGEARELARVAGRNNWVTPHMLDTLNRADHGEHGSTQAFKVTARAHLEPEAPEDWPENWPENVGGYTTDLTVIAKSEDEAREFTLSYLKELEPSASLSFDVRIVGQGSSLQDHEDLRRPCGVAAVDEYRAYFTSAC